MTARNNKIDFLRGVAIFAVLILHFNIAYQLGQSALNQFFTVNFINLATGNGNYGVTIFFVISGFLITQTSLERYGALNKIEYLNFYIYRFSRIMPCLILVLALIALFGALHIPIFENEVNTTSLALAIFSVLTFWHNVLMEKLGYFNYCLNIFWSLSVEEIFYLAFPLLCLFFKKTKWIVIFLLSLILMGPLYRSFYTSNDIVALYGYLSCFDAIAIGCTAAIFINKVKLNRYVRKSCLYSGAFLLLTVYFYSQVMQNVVFGVSFIAIGSAIFLMGASVEESSTNQSFFSRFFCLLGKMSYELYLFHIIVLALMKEIVNPALLNNNTKLLWLALFMGSSVLIASIIATFFSFPMNKKLRTLLLQSRTPSTVLM